MYELIFLKNPHIFTEEDKENYFEILQYSGSHLNAIGNIKGNKGSKYKKIIAPMFNKRGNGLKFSDVSVKDKTEYIYWDNPGELIDRLQLLIGERNAGHTGLEN